MPFIRKTAATLLFVIFAIAVSGAGLNAAQSGPGAEDAQPTAVTPTARQQATQQAPQQAMQRGTQKAAKQAAKAGRQAAKPGQGHSH
jgi:hypothetical protein